MESTVPHPSSAHCLPALNALEARTLPLIGLPPTARSLMTSPTPAKPCAFPDSGELRMNVHRLVADQFGDPITESVGSTFLTPHPDDLLELVLELEALVAGWALVQMLLDDEPTLLGELAVQVVVQDVQRLV